MDLYGADKFYCTKYVKIHCMNIFLHALQFLLCMYVDTVCTLNFLNAWKLLVIYIFVWCTVPGPIASVNISTVSSTELNVSWTPPTSPNGIILHYVFAYTSAPEQNIPHEGELTARSDLTSVVLNGLYEGVQYHLRMWAVTEVGPGPELTAEGTTYTAGKKTRCRLSLTCVHDCSRVSSATLMQF